MGVEFLKKKIWLREDKGKWCWCFVFKKKSEMRVYYKKVSPQDKNHDFVRGCSIHFYRYKGKILSRKTGVVLLNFEDGCGAGVTTHELLHAVLFANQHHKTKPQYPIVIKSMEQEEKILHSHTFAVNQFYKWYWKKVEPSFK